MNRHDFVFSVIFFLLRLVLVYYDSHIFWDGHGTRLATKLYIVIRWQCSGVCNAQLSNRFYPACWRLRFNILFVTLKSYIVWCFFYFEFVCLFSFDFFPFLLLWNIKCNWVQPDNVIWAWYLPTSIQYNSEMVGAVPSSNWFKRLLWLANCWVNAKVQ